MKSEFKEISYRLFIQLFNKLCYLFINLAKTFNLKQSHEFIVIKSMF